MYTRVRNSLKRDETGKAKLLSFLRLIGRSYPDSADCWMLKHRNLLEESEDRKLSYA